MDRKEYLLKVKTAQKKRAEQIRGLKRRRKIDKRGDMPLWEIDSDIASLRFVYRHNHIAYCLLRGRDREVIEKPSENNQPNERYVNELLADYTKAVCPSED